MLLSLLVALLCLAVAPAAFAELDVNHPLVAAALAGALVGNAIVFAQLARAQASGKVRIDG